MKISNTYIFNHNLHRTFGAKKATATTVQSPRTKESAITVQEINPTNKALLEKLKVIFELKEDDLNEKVNQYFKDRFKNVCPGFYFEDKGKPTLELTNIIGQNLYSCTQYSEGKDVSYRLFVVDLKEQKIKDVFDIRGDKIYGPRLKTEKTNNERITKALVALNEYENNAKRAKLIEIMGSISNVQEQLFSFIEKQEKTNADIYNNIEGVYKTLNVKLEEIRKELEKHSLSIQALKDNRDSMNFYLKIWAQSGVLKIPEKPSVIGGGQKDGGPYFWQSDLSEEAVEAYLIEYCRGNCF